MQVELKDLLEIRNGADYRNIDEGDVPVYGSGGQITSINKWLYDGESILLPRKGTLDNILFVYGKFWTIDTMYWSIVNKNKVVPYYLYNYLRILRFNNLHTGSTLPSMTTKAYYSIKLDLPSLDIQKKVAYVLKILDSKIELNNKINEELEKIAKTLYDYWFVQFDFPDENNRPYKSSGGAMVYNEELKRKIPKGWEIKSLYEIAEYTNGLACQNYRPVNGEFYNVIKIKEMHEGFSCDTEHVRIDVPKKYIVENGDILFSWSATLEIQQWIGGKGVLNQHIFKVTSNHYPKSFYYFEIKNYINVFKRIAETRKTTMGHITIDHLKQAKIIIPPSHLIKKLDTKITPVFYFSIKLKEENQRLMRIRDFLLPMLLNGQVKVI